MHRSSLRLLGAGLAVVIALFAGGQVLIPGIVEGDAEERLTAGGGSAEVEISAVPALGLLFGRGGSIKVRGADIPVDLLDADDPLERLDGFASVDVKLERLTAGPLEDATFELRRSSDRDAGFSMSVVGRMTPEGAARYAGEQVAGPLGGLIGDLTGVLPFGNEPLPVEIEAIVVRAEGGDVRITDGGGSIAGIPLGPFTELLVEAVAARL